MGEGKGRSWVEWDVKDCPLPQSQDDAGENLSPSPTILLSKGQFRGPLHNSALPPSLRHLFWHSHTLLFPPPTPCAPDANSALTPLPPLIYLPSTSLVARIPPSLTHSKTKHRLIGQNFCQVRHVLWNMSLTSFIPKQKCVSRSRAGGWRFLYEHNNKEKNARVCKRAAHNRCQSEESGNTIRTNL